MIDAHAHLHDEKYDADRDATIARFFDGGGEAIVNIGTSLHESRSAVELANDYDNIFATVGVHPHVFNGGAKRAQEWQADIGVDVPMVVRRERLEEAIYDLQDLIDESDKVVAVGEIGLDYFSHDDDAIRDDQKHWQVEGFRAQIALAAKNDLPVVIHARTSTPMSNDAYEDILKILNSNVEILNSKFVMHCYMGNRAVSEKFLALPHVAFSFTGNVTYSKKDDDEMSKVIKMVPLARMMIETDAPYLAPVPHRGKRNEPLYVKHVAERIAQLKNTSVKEVLNKTTQNTKEFFAL